MTAHSRITRVILKNYKSFALADVPLEPLPFLVGPNGAAKSNFIDALRFCRDALRTPLDQVFAKRNTNLYNLRHRSPANPESLEMRFEFVLVTGQTGYYSFTIGPQSPRGYEVRREKCVIYAFEDQPEHSFDRPTPNRLHLVNASGSAEYQPVYELLSSMEFYTPDPEMMRVDLDTTGSADVLDEDGENAASVLDRLIRTQKDTKDRIEQYLRAIVPGLERVGVEGFREYKLLNFYLAARRFG
jgi:predicted ATPase